MKLCKNLETNKIHVSRPNRRHFPISFCGVGGLYFSGYRYYEGSEDEITCNNCKISVQKYIVNKLKGR